MSALTDILQRPGRNPRRRILSLIGILLVPFVVAGVLVWALWNPTERLENVNAAIVNNDEPVTVDGQLVPLGRQLSAELVRAPGSDVQNYNWTLSDDTEAAAGLKSGKYVAVITIPKDFSAAATSAAGDHPKTATIDVATSDRSRLVDDAISNTIAGTAASLAGNQITTNYLENVLLGFNTLGTQLGEAADGARQLGTGAGAVNDGVAELGDGVAQLGAGASQLSSGASQLSSGTAGLASGAGALNSGVSQLAAGSAPLASGARDLAGGLGEYTAGVSSLAGGLDQSVQGANGLVTLAQKSSAMATGLATQATAQATALSGLFAQCEAAGLSDCAALRDARNAAMAMAHDATVLSMLTGTDVPENQPNSIPGLASVADSLAQGLGAASAGARTLSENGPALVAGAQGLADGAGQLNSGVQQLSGGASQLASGARQLAGGASGLASGAAGLNGGIGALGEGIAPLGEGTEQIKTGIDSLGEGLNQAVDQLPSYTEQQRKKLSEVVATPVTTGGSSSGTASIGEGLGSAGAPFYAVLALWLGALASFLVLRALPLGAHGSTRPSALLTLRAFLPGAILGALQGVLVAGLLQFLLKLDTGAWIGFAATAALVGIAFAASNQALSALFGGAGKFISMIVALVVMATGIIATVPAVLTGLESWLPVGPAAAALRGIATGTGVGGAIAALIVWTLGALIVTTLAARRARQHPEVTAA